MSAPKQQKYSTEFKESSVKLAIESPQPIANTARALGINVNTLYNWVEKHTKIINGTETRAPNGKSTYDEIIKLKKDLARVTQERDLLKKAAPYFAKESR